MEGDEIGQLAALALCGPLSSSSPPDRQPLDLSPPLLHHLGIMVDLPGRDTPPLSQRDLLRELKMCRDAFKRAASMQRMVEETGTGPDLSSLDPEMAGPEMALCGLASRLLDPNDSSALDRVFASLDKDGSGSLDGCELIMALKAFEPNLNEEEVRVVLAYIHHYGDQDKSGGVSVKELRLALLPFVPGPAHDELRVLVEGYERGEVDVFKLLVEVVQLQPSSLHAAFTQLGLKTQRKRADGASSPEEVSLPATAGTIDSVLGLILPSNMVVVKQADKDHLASLILLDNDKASSNITASIFITAALSCVDSVKRAQALLRMVGTDHVAGEPIVFDQDIGGAELILNNLATIFKNKDSASADAAFRAADKDKSGSLDLGELAGVIRGLHPEITDDETRLLLSFLFESETDSDKKVKLKELKTILTPFYVDKT